MRAATTSAAATFSRICSRRGGAEEHGRDRGLASTKAIASAAGVVPTSAASAASSRAGAARRPPSAGRRARRPSGRRRPSRTCRSGSRRPARRTRPPSRRTTAAPRHLRAPRPSRARPGCRAAARRTAAGRPARAPPARPRRALGRPVDDPPGAHPAARDELGDRADHLVHRQLGRRRVGVDEVEVLEAGALQRGRRAPAAAVCSGQNSHHSLFGDRDLVARPARRRGRPRRRRPPSSRSGSARVPVSSL